MILKQYFDHLMLFGLFVLQVVRLVHIMGLPWSSYGFFGLLNFFLLWFFSDVQLLFFYDFVQLFPLGQNSSALPFLFNEVGFRFPFHIVQSTALCKMHFDFIQCQVFIIFINIFHLIFYINIFIPTFL